MGCQGSKTATVPATSASNGLTLLSPTSGKNAKPQESISKHGKSVGFTDIVEVPLGKGNTAKVVDWMLNDPNGLKYTTAQKGNISATGSTYTTEEGVEMIVFFGEWESKEDFDAYFTSEGRTNESWKEFCKNFAGEPKITAMASMTGQSMLATDANKAAKNLVGFTDIVEVPLGKGNTSKVVDWLLNDPNGLKYTTAQKGNISATGNIYTTAEGVEMVVFFGEWASKADFDAYFTSEGRTNESWTEFCKNFAGAPKITGMTPMSKYLESVPVAESEFVPVAESDAPNVSVVADVAGERSSYFTCLQYCRSAEAQTEILAQKD
jgi:quinol monooxygenase YgiN